MGEINERESELNAARDRLIEQEEEMRTISVTKQKLSHERDFLVQELKVLTKRFEDLQAKYNDQARLLVSVVSHNKNPASNTMMANNTMSSSTLEGAGAGDNA